MTAAQAQNIVNTLFTFEDAMKGIPTFNNDGTVNPAFIEYCSKQGYTTK